MKVICHFTLQGLLSQLKESIIIQHSIEKNNSRKTDRKPNYAPEIPVVVKNSYPLPAYNNFPESINLPIVLIFHHFNHNTFITSQLNEKVIHEICTQA